MRKLISVLSILTLLFLVSPVSVTFAQTSGLDNTVTINDNNNLQIDVTYIASGSGNDENHMSSSHDSHSAHGDHHGPGGESKTAIYVSVLSVLGIFVLLGLAYLALRKSMKES